MVFEAISINEYIIFLKWFFVSFYAYKFIYIHIYKYFIYPIYVMIYKLTIKVLLLFILMCLKRWVLIKPI